MFGKILIIIGLAAAGLLLVIMNVTEPSSVGAIGILGVFLLGYIISLVVTSFFLWVLSGIIYKFAHGARLLRNSERLTLRKAYYYATVIALAPIITISLQSVGGISAYEVALTILFIVIGCVYVSRRT